MLLCNKNRIGFERKPWCSETTTPEVSFMKNAKEVIAKLKELYGEKLKPGDRDIYNYLNLAVNDDAALNPEQEEALEIIFGSVITPSNAMEILQIATWINSCH